MKLDSQILKIKHTDFKNVLPGKGFFFNNVFWKEKILL